MALTAEEVEARRSYIGSSDVGAIIGVNEWCTPHQVWLSKMGLAEFVGNDATEAGNDFEPVIVARAAKHNGFRSLPGRIVRGPEEWMACQLDALIEGGGIVEAKMVGFDSAWEWGSESDGVPFSYLVQCQWQLLCTNEPFVLVAAQMGTRHKYYRIEPDTELQCMLADRCRAFWFGHVVPKVPPPIDGSEGAKEMLKALSPRSNGTERAATPEEEELASRLLAAKEHLSVAEKETLLVENLLRQSVGDASRVIGAGWRIRYANDRRGVRAFNFELSKAAKAARRAA